ncbi:MAG: endonuclease III [Nanoarchaeota archaeon]
MNNLAGVITTLEGYYKKERRTTLNRMRERPNAFKILISCLISLRTRDETTERISRELFKIADTPEKIARMDVKRLEKIVYSSGYYKNKARTIKHVANVILEKYNGGVPDTEKELLSIKGIGRKTANIVLCFAYRKDVIPVDVNVHRIVNRLGWVRTKNAEQTERELIKIIPKKYWRELNGLFILHGKNICVPMNPFCSKCPVVKYCKRVGVVKSR